MESKQERSADTLKRRATTSELGNQPAAAFEAARVHAVEADSSNLEGLGACLAKTLQTTASGARGVYVQELSEALARWHFTTLKSPGRPEVAEFWLCDQHLKRSKAESQGRGRGLSGA